MTMNIGQNAKINPIKALENKPKQRAFESKMKSSCPSTLKNKGKDSHHSNHRKVKREPWE